MLVEKGISTIAPFPETIPAPSTPGNPGARVPGARICSRLFGSRTQCGDVGNAAGRPDHRELPEARTLCQGLAGHPRACLAQTGQAHAHRDRGSTAVPADGGEHAGKAVTFLRGAWLAQNEDLVSFAVLGYLILIYDHFLPLSRRTLQLLNS